MEFLYMEYHMPVEEYRIQRSAHPNQHPEGCQGWWQQGLDARRQRRYQECIQTDGIH